VVSLESPENKLPSNTWILKIQKEDVFLKEIWNLFRYTDTVEHSQLKVPVPYTVCIQFIVKKTSLKISFSEPRRHLNFFLTGIALRFGQKINTNYVTITENKAVISVGKKGECPATAF